MNNLIESYSIGSQFSRDVEKLQVGVSSGIQNEFGIEETSYQEMLQSNVRRMSSTVSTFCLHSLYTDLNFSKL